jgi:chromate reductase
MPEPVRVLAISGSLRSASLNTVLLRLAQEHAPAGVELQIYDGLAGLPHYNEDDEPAPGPAVDDLRERIAAADALLVATPEYNGSIPGALKNLVDWASRPFGTGALVGKPVTVIGASTSPFAAAWARDELRKSLTIAGARVVGEGLGVGRAADHLADPAADLRAEVAALVAALADETLPTTVAA